MTLIWNNKAWMHNVNPDLLRRLWMKKGCPGVFISSFYGVRMESQRYSTGILNIITGSIAYHVRPLRLEGAKFAYSNVERG